MRDTKESYITNLKIYVNGKRSRKKIKFDKNGWRFIRPLTLTKKDTLYFTWNIILN